MGECGNCDRDKKSDDPDRSEGDRSTAFHCRLSKQGSTLNSNANFKKLTTDAVFVWPNAQLNANEQLVDWSIEIKL